MNYTEALNYLCKEHKSGYNKSEAEIQRDWENYQNVTRCSYEFKKGNTFPKL